MAKRIEIDLEQVREFAAQGLTQEQVAQCLGVSARTVSSRLAEDADFAAAYKEGQAAGIQRVANALWQNAAGGNVTAQIFFLKARAQWKDRHDDAPDDTPAPQRIQVEIVNGDSDPD